MIDLDAKEYLLMEESSLYFVKQVYDLVPQPLKPEYEARFAIGLLLRGDAWKKFCETVRPHWFQEFQKGKHLTWQQSLVLYGVDKALRKEIPMRISIVSGHGIGKSMVVSILILWFLFVHPDCKIGCTAPSADQMYDVLWSEVKKWIEKMPKDIAQMYIWETTHVRMKEAPESWFARAKTSSKENTEALAGIHADWVMLMADEASGVEEPIFETMEGALTSGNTLILLISNGTRSIGYFYDTHHKDKDQWQNYAFDSEESPIVDQKFIDGIIAKYGNDSVQFFIRVKGKFPNEGVMDDKGYVQLLNDKDINIVSFDPEWKPVGRVQASLDAAGEGQDEAEWAVRDRMRAACVAEEKTSTPSSMAVRSLTVCDKYGVDPIDFIIDAFGKGHQVSQEIALATAKQKRPWRVTPINTGDQCEDPTDKLLFVNIRAMLYYRLMLWARAGGEFMDSPGLLDELKSIRFKRTTNGRIQIMDKVSMKKLGFKSPNKADALSMTFYRPDNLEKRSFLGEQQTHDDDFDPNQTMG